jgi:hypothetical protein
MHDNSWVWVLIPIFAIMAGVARTWVRARHGYPLDRHDRKRHRGPANEVADLKSALDQRDAIIAKLEDRVRVLERIATDRPAALREEIERL